MGSAPTSPSATLALLRRSEHVLFGGLLAVGAARAPHTLPLTAGAILVACWYAAGFAVARRTRDRRLAAAWLAGLVAGWAALTAGSTAFVWLAFPLFLLCMQLLPLAWSIPAVAGVAAGAVAAIAVDRGRLDAAAVVGPLVGAAVAVVIILVYQDLAEQVRERTRLLDQLTAAQQELADAQHRAGVLAERERLSREIHDTITQSLASIMLVLRTARSTGVSDPRALQAQLDTAITAAGGALADTRRLVADLTPAELAGDSLPNALRRTVTDAGDPRTRLTIEGRPWPMPTAVAVMLLRIAQEALANARTHAHASRIEVTLTYLLDAVSLDVADDGVGFDPDQPLGPTTGTGVGIAGMRSRAAQAGGVFCIDAAPAQGTAVNVTVARQDEAS